MATTERSNTPATDHLVTRNYGKTESVLEVPHLIEMPKRSHERFMRESARHLFDDAPLYGQALDLSSSTTTASTEYPIP